MTSTQELSRTYESEMIANRRHIHAHPELGGSEAATVQFIAGQLEKMGLTPNTHYSQHACSALLEGRPGGKVIMLRADIDALPVTEDTGLPFASQNKGVMHACGHDVHTAALLGAARILYDLKDELQGTVKFCFQPAEEVKGIGACIMVEDGILEHPKVDFVMGAHVSPSLPVGTVTANPGPVSAYPDSFSIQITGKGSHGSAPHKGNDPIRAALAAYEMINALSLRIDPLEAHLIQICTIHAGTAYNIIPDTSSLGGTVRTLTPESRQICKEGIADVCKAIETAFGVRCEMNGFGPATPPVVNDPACTLKAQESLRKVITGEIVPDNADLLGGEDFSFYQQTGIPAFFVRYGVANDSELSRRPLHNPQFSPDERAISIGAAIYAQVAYDYLTSGF